MDEIQLNVQIRKGTRRKHIKSLRQRELIPAVVYGGEREPTTISVNQREYQKIMYQHQGQSSIVFHLNVLEGDKKLRDYATLLKEQQFNPVSNQLMHIDFLRISLTKEIDVKVAIVAKGEPEGTTKDGGSLDQPLWELDIVCLPTNIPAQIEVDVSTMNIGDAIYVKDLAIPQGVKTNHDPEAIVFSLIPPMKEEEEVPVEEEESDSTEPEVIKKEKKDSEDSEISEQPRDSEEKKAEGKS